MQHLQNALLLRPQAGHRVGTSWVGVPPTGHCMRREWSPFWIQAGLLQGPHTLILPGGGADILWVRVWGAGEWRAEATDLQTP